MFRHKSEKRNWKTRKISVSEAQNFLLQIPKYTNTVAHKRAYKIRRNNNSRKATRTPIKASTQAYRFGEPVYFAWISSLSRLHQSEACYCVFFFLLSMLHTSNDAQAKHKKNNSGSFDEWRKHRHCIKKRQAKHIFSSCSRFLLACALVEITSNPVTRKKMFRSVRFWLFTKQWSEIQVQVKVHFKCDIELEKNNKRLKRKRHLLH